MQDEPPYFASFLSKMTTVNSKMVPIQVVHNICVIALKNPRPAGVTSLSCCSVHVDENSIDKDNTTASSYIH